MSVNHAITGQSRHCGFLPFDDPDGDAKHEASYRFRSDCWNQGFGTESLQACLVYGFTHFSLPVVLAVVEAANVGSVRVLQKARFRDVKDTFYHDIPVRKYLITKEDFQQMHAEATSKSAPSAASEASDASRSL